MKIGILFSDQINSYSFFLKGNVICMSLDPDYFKNQKYEEIEIQDPHHMFQLGQMDSDNKFNQPNRVERENRINRMNREEKLAPLIALANKSKESDSKSPKRIRYPS